MKFLTNDGFAVRYAERLSLSVKAKKKVRLRLTPCAKLFYERQPPKVRFLSGIAARFSRLNADNLQPFRLIQL